LIRVGILSAGLALRLGLREVFQEISDVEVTAEGSDPDSLPSVDVLVLTSADYLVELGEEPPPLLLLTDEQEDALKLTDFPVWGVLSPDASSEELASALRALAEGLWVGSPVLMQNLLERRALPYLEDAELVTDPLTDREREVLQLVAEGLANKQIALSLSISEHTVKFHLSSLYAKLGVTSRTEAVRMGARRGWVVL
jgi:DNA-binding NarL/FixJ family response regulator